MHSDLLLTLTSHFLCFSLALGLDTSDSDCKEEGQFMVNPDDFCTYFRCVGLRSDKGKVILYKIRMQCATGTVTDLEQFEPQNACSRTVDAGTCPTTCQRLGQFLPGDDECHFKVCSYGTNSWQNILGSSVLEALQQPCPGGTSLDRTKSFNEISPCNKQSNICSSTTTPKTEKKASKTESGVSSPTAIPKSIKS